MRYSICIPTLNAASNWKAVESGVLKQTLVPDRVLVIDSESTDGTDTLALRAGFCLERVARKNFRHGATRQHGIDLLIDSDVIVFLTQDVILGSPDAIGRLVSRFDDPQVGAVYGRQLPRKGSGLIEAHARNFNYPPESAVRTLESAAKFGFKTVFFSDSFGAYRRSALQATGGFARDVNFGEDTLAAARLLLDGWKVVYEAEAEVYHSHAYTIVEEYKRYVKIGRLHARHAYLLGHFGHAGGEGFRFIRSQFAMLSRNAPQLLPSAALRAACKYAGYKAGSLHALKQPDREDLCKV